MTGPTTRAAVDVYLSAGSNIDPIANLRLACAELTARYGHLRRSSVYRSAPVGFEGDDFLNMVIAMRTDEDPVQIIEFLESVHTKSGRVRTGNRLSPHTLDIDLLLYGDLVSNSPVRVPRADITEYAFVLAPMAELAPALRHPVDGRSMAELWAAYPADLPLQKVAVNLE